MAELKIKADSGGGTVSFKGPATTTSNAAVQLTLPVDDGTSGQYLKTDGSGALSWATVDTSIADDSIVEAKLDIHAAPSGTDKFLGYTSNGMEWAVPSGTGKILQVVETKHTGESTFTSTSYADYTPLNLSITAATGSKIIVFIVVKFFVLGEASIGYGNQANFGLKVMRSDDGFSSDSHDLYTSHSDSGGKYAAFLAGHDGTVTLVMGGTVSNNFYDESPGGDGSKNITYKVQACKGHADMGNLYLGKGGGSSMILMEVGS